jgi:hypothetical protein
MPMSYKDAFNIPTSQYRHTYSNDIGMYDEHMNNFRFTDGRQGNRYEGFASSSQPQRTTPAQPSSQPQRTTTASATATAASQPQRTTTATSSANQMQCPIQPDNAMLNLQENPFSTTIATYNAYPAYAAGGAILLSLLHAIFTLGTLI